MLGSTLGGSRPIIRYLVFVWFSCICICVCLYLCLQEEGTPRFSGTKFSCCGKTERSFWNDKMLKNSGCQKNWSCCGGEKNSKGCSSVEQHLCCQVLSQIQIQIKIQIHFQLGKKKHLSPPVRRHIPVTEFPNPGWGFNPFNWDLGGIWTVQYRSEKKNEHFD